MRPLQRVFGIPEEAAEAAEKEESQPYRLKAEAVASYHKVFSDALQYENPLSEGIRLQLRRFQRLLELSDDEVQNIEAVILHTVEEQRQALEVEQARREAEAERQRREVEAISSERFGANYYAKLHDLLAAQDWQAANEETARRMCEVMGRQEEGWLRVEDFDNFPYLDLCNIDRL
jgi:hypothetical protein